MAISLGSFSGNNIFANCTATLNDSTVNITAPTGFDEFRFYAPTDYSTSQTYAVNSTTHSLLKLNGQAPVNGEWVSGAPITLILKDNVLYVRDV